MSELLRLCMLPLLMISGGTEFGERILNQFAELVRRMSLLEILDGRRHYGI